MTRPLLFIDSGAYSAETKGVKIAIGEYIAFLKANAKYVEVAATLDVLFNAEASWENQMVMEAEGIMPMPTFHFGEPVSWLKRYVERYERIALGGQVGQSTGDLVRWLDETWQYLTDANGAPVVKVHGFGVTSATIMSRYPWFSVDSTSWLMSAANGRAMFYVPELHTLEPIAVSEKSPFKDKRNGHIDSMVPAYRDALMARIERSGFTLEQLATDYKQRFYLNARSFVEYAAATPYRTFVPPNPGLFGRPWVPQKQALPPWEHLTIYLAGNPGSGQMTKDLMLLGYNRLLSYHYIVESPTHFNFAKEVLDHADQAQ